MIIPPVPGIPGCAQFLVRFPSLARSSGSLFDQFLVRFPAVARTTVSFFDHFLVRFPSLARTSGSLFDQFLVRFAPRFAICAQLPKDVL